MAPTESGRPDGPRPAAPDVDVGEWGFDLDDPDDRWMASIAAAEEPEQLGRIGDYELVAEVSRGGQGVVFRARQPGTGRDIALKRLIAGQFATAAMRRRFQREVETAASLSHPNIVTVYGLDIVDGQPLLAMEWIDGVPITAWAAERSRDPAEVIEMFLRVCDAMRHAHAHGVLHRDLKPSNVLVDAQGQPHVLDFGLAKRFDGTGDERTVTLSADFVGTPAYCSPEALSTDGRALDERSDVYSLGVVLYQMLSGVAPFGEKQSVGELLRAVETEEPAKPSAHDPRLAGEVDTIVGKALAKDRADRYASVDELAGDLRRHLAGRPILALPPSAWTRLVKTARRNRLAFGLTAAVFVLLVAFAVAAWRHALELEGERRIAVDARDAERESRAAAQREADNANAMLSFLLHDLLMSADPRGGSGRNTITLEGALDQAALAIGERFDEQPSTEASVRLLVAQLYQGLGRHSDARLHYERAEELLELQDEADPEELVDLWLGLAYVIGIEQPDPIIVDYQRRALALLEREVDGPHPRKLKVLNHLASNLIYMERPDEAAPVLELALEMAPALGEAGHVGHANALLNLGEVDVRAGRYESAERHYRAAEKLYRETQGEELFQYTQYLRKVAWVASVLDKPDEAVAGYRRSLEILEKVVGPQHYETQMAKRELAEFLTAQGQYDEARGLYEDVLAAFAEESQESIPYARAVYAYGDMLADLGDHARAEELLRRAFEIHRRVSGEDHRSTAYTKNRLAEVWLALGDVRGAEALQREALDYVARKEGTRSSSYALVLADLALCVLRAGRHAEAHELLREALALHGTGTLHDLAWVQGTLLELGFACLQAGDAQRAFDVLAELLQHLRTERLASDDARLQAEVGLVDALLRLGRGADADRILGDYAAALRRQVGDDHAPQQRLRDHALRLYAHHERPLPAGIAPAAAAAAEGAQ